MARERPVRGDGAAVGAGREPLRPGAAAGERRGTARAPRPDVCGAAPWRGPVRGPGRLAAAAGVRRGTARDLPACDGGRPAGRAAGRVGAAAGARRGAARGRRTSVCGRAAGARRGAARGRRTSVCGRAAGARRAGGRCARAAGAERGAAARPPPPSRRRARCSSSAQTAGATSASTKETARRQEAVRDITNLLWQAGGTKCSRDRARIGGRLSRRGNRPSPRGVSPGAGRSCPLPVPGARAPESRCTGASPAPPPGAALPMFRPLHGFGPQ